MAIIEFVGREGEIRPARPGTAKAPVAAPVAAPRETFAKAAAAMKQGQGAKQQPELR